MIEAIAGAAARLIGASVDQALLANDRAKYLLALLQLAFDQARDPRAEADTLAAGRRQVGLDDPRLDRVNPSARRAGEDGGSPSSTSRTSSGS